jgi:hypothetical protein
MTATTLSRAGAAVLLLMLLPCAARAQNGPNLQVVPKIGVFTPLGTLTANTEIELGLALGAAGELTLPGLPFNLRINVDHAITTDVVERAIAETALGQVSITNIVGDVVLRPLPATAALQPYFMAGGGVKSYSLDSDIGWVGDLSGVAGTVRRGTLHVGGGVDARFGPLALLLEISDYISTFLDSDGGSRLQNHLYGMVGFRVTMF